MQFNEDKIKLMDLNNRKMKIHPPSPPQYKGKFCEEIMHFTFIFVQHEQEINVFNENVYNI